MRNIFINGSVLNKKKKIFYADIYITENKQGSKQTSEGMSISHAMWIKSEVDTIHSGHKNGLLGNFISD